MRNTSTETGENRDRRRKVAAVLAGGLVVGVGTMATLATWNSAEYASGTFTAGKFNLQGSVDQTAFSDYESAPGAGLSFSTPVSALTPGDTVYAGYALRLDKNSSNAGAVVVSAQAGTGDVSNLTYSLFTTNAKGCSDTSTIVTKVVADGTAVGTVGSPTTFTVAKPSGGSDGAPVYLCFKVTAGSSLQQGQTGTATWKFTATSV